MKITKIERQKKNKERYSLFIDGDFAFGVSEDVLIRFALTKNMVLNQEELDAIKASEASEYLFNKALNYLSYGLRTKKELQVYLKKQLDKEDALSEDEEQLEDIQKVIERLEYLNLLDDLSYGKAFVQTKMTINRKGPKVIQQELFQKGLNKATIEASLDHYSQTDQKENIDYLAHKFLKSNNKLPAKALKQKLHQHLLMKGFERDLIVEWMNEFVFNSIVTDEEALVESEALKIVKRRQAKFQGRDLEQKVKEGLYRKGFEIELIQNWLNKNEAYFLTDDN